MKALVWLGPNRMQVEERPRPGGVDGRVLLSVGAAGVCGSEVEGYLGKMGNRTPPLVMGHEFAATALSGELEGRLVAVNPIISCQECFYCRRGERNLCPTRVMIGIATPGGFAELCEAPSYCLRPLPETADARLGALVEPFANGVHAARLGLQDLEAEHALVLGAGTIGLFVLQAVRLNGVPWVGVVEPHAGRREWAARLGASEVFASGEEALAAIAERRGGIGPDLVLDAVGAEVTRRLAVEGVRPGGTVVALGLHSRETTLEFHGVVRRQVRIQGSYAYTDSDFDQALEWLASGEAGLGQLEGVLPLDAGPAVFEELAAGPSERLKVFLGPVG